MLMFRHVLMPPFSYRVATLKEFRYYYASHLRYATPRFHHTRYAYAIVSHAADAARHAR